MRVKELLALACFALLLPACTGLHYLRDGEVLYNGASVKFDKRGDVPGTKSLSKDIAKVIAPKPNSKLLGFARPKLCLYYLADTPKRKGFSYWLKYKIGEPPVLISKVYPSSTTALISNRLDNNGYFRSQVSYDMEVKKKTAKVRYTAVLHTPYMIDSVTYPLPTDSLRKNIVLAAGDRTFREGDLYNLYQLKAERERIDQALKNRGFFFFNPDYLVFYADTSVGNHKVNLRLDVKDDAPKEGLLQYRIGKVLINPNYSLAQDSLRLSYDTLLIEGKYYIRSDSAFKPKIIVRSVFLNPGDLYSRTKHNLSLRRLMGLGTFKFATIRFNDTMVRDTPILNSEVLLTPLFKKSIRAEVLAISKSTNFAGPGVNVNYRNRNLFGGSELFVLSCEAGFETQIAKKSPGQPSLGSFNLSADATLYLPKFLIPFAGSSAFTGVYVPKTKFSISGEQVYHVQYYTLNSATFAFGYYWRQTETIEHELDPLVINYVHTSRTTPLFDSLLEEEPYLQADFEEQFIVGLKYGYTFNNQVLQNRTNQYYFNGQMEFAGNAVSLVNRIFTGTKADAENPQKIFGTPYSQFSRFSIDARYFHTFHRKNKIATRIISGIGIPYGNSASLPYVKEFFIGGSNSIRAFRARSIGPGTYAPPNNSLSFHEQAGDIKIEMNAEYRFNLVSIIKGAVFVDAGNIWLLKADSNRVGGQFERDFYKEFAVGTGFGIRADASIFVVRLDLAWPIRKPWLDEGSRWVIDDINFGSSAWRKDNLVLNIAIGYPF